MNKTFLHFWPNFLVYYLMIFKSRRSCETLKIHQKIWQKIKYSLFQLDLKLNPFFGWLWVPYQLSLDEIGIIVPYEQKLIKLDSHLSSTVSQIYSKKCDFYEKTTFKLCSCLCRYRIKKIINQRFPTEMILFNQFCPLCMVHHECFAIW